MLNLGNNKIYLYSKPVHMLKSFEGLSSIAQDSFPGKIFNGCCFVFLNRLRDKIKVLNWEGDGYSIYYKRLEKGKFPIDSNGNTELTRRDFMMMFEGVKPKKKEPRFFFKKEAI